MNMLNLILFGPPGSGKGTQAERLEEAYNLVHISTGELFRSEMEEGTELGIRANEYMSRGELVPDEVTIGMLRNKMTYHTDAEGFIFDGFPRTAPQAEALDQLLGEMDQQIDALIMLDVPEDEIVKRILLRGKDSTGRMTMIRKSSANDSRSTRPKQHRSTITTIKNKKHTKFQVSVPSMISSSICVIPSIACTSDVLRSKLC